MYKKRNIPNCSYGIAHSLFYRLHLYFLIYDIKQASFFWHTSNEFWDGTGIFLRSSLFKASIGA